MSDSGYDLPGELRAVADAIEDGVFDVEQADRGAFRVGDDTIAVEGEWLE